MRYFEVLVVLTIIVYAQLPLVADILDDQIAATWTGAASDLSHGGASRHAVDNAAASSQDEERLGRLEENLRKSRENLERTKSWSRPSPYNNPAECHQPAGHDIMKPEEVRRLRENQAETKRLVARSRKIRDEKGDDPASVLNNQLFQLGTQQFLQDMAKPAGNVTYVCPMAECNVRSSKPGRCPKCGMKLTSVTSLRGDEDRDDGPVEVIRVGKEKKPAASSSRSPRRVRTPAARRESDSPSPAPAMNLPQGKFMLGDEEKYWEGELSSDPNVAEQQLAALKSQCWPMDDPPRWAGAHFQIRKDELVQTGRAKFALVQIVH